jgi:hypothetical protein
MDDYNRRFARTPKNPHNAHRPLLPEEDLSRIFTWQEERMLTRNLVVHFKRVSYLVTPSAETIPLGGKRVQIRERENGEVEIWHGNTRLPYSVYDKNPHVGQGAIVENKRLGAALTFIRALQAERDEKRLASKKLTLREKQRLRETIAQARPVPPASVDQRMLQVFESMRARQAEHDAKKREQNRRSQERFRARQRAGLQVPTVRSPMELEARP